MRILADEIGNVLLQLRDCPSAVQKSAEVVIDLSPQGSWIRGFEMIGGMFDFSLRKAVAIFVPNIEKFGKSGDRKMNNRPPYPLDDIRTRVLLQFYDHTRKAITHYSDLG